MLRHRLLKQKKIESSSSAVHLVVDQMDEDVLGQVEAELVEPWAAGTKIMS